MKKIVLALALLILTTFSAFAQTLEAKVNRNNVPNGETFLLTIELKNGRTNQTPDFSVLNQNFTTYSVATSYRTNIINGNAQQSQQWNLILMPNSNGKLIIPEIKLDNMQTKPIEIIAGVTAELQSNNNQSTPASPKFKIKGDVDNTKPYVQQQINYTLTIYDTGGLQGNAPTFLANNDDWIIKTLGEPVIVSKNINGQTYREITFKYALFAQKSGITEIPAVRFDGYYLTKEHRNDPFRNLFDDDMFMSGFAMHDVFATRNPIVLTAEPIKIEVLPAPSENANNWWLPADEVKLYAEFVPQRPEFKVGEAVTRNIYLQASGVIDSQLPEINFMETEGLKQYPEKPQMQMDIKNGKIIATEKIINVYIPAKSGELTLPEIGVNWFDVKTKSFKKAILPEQKIMVRETPQTSTNIAPKSDTPTSNQSIEAEAEAEAEAETEAKVIKDTSYWLVGGAFLLGMGLCLLALGIISLFRNNKANTYKSVINSAKAKDLHLVRDALLTWGAEKFPNQSIVSLQDIDNLINDKEFRCELDKLTEALYAKENTDWNNGLFIRVFNKIHKRNKTKKNFNEPLPKLYK